ncbi:uncharacterized protein A4U43_C07F20540 [Asparagus officinalis]|uniref:Uncharacterized protein n=1 Tax=Asparagus officinalis TaxID=4686 RepID=A0A5P1EDH7_ASPOF|nr:uncharacterized protein A4U43_C07F20540 [Asparagus officinalis]
MADKIAMLKLKKITYETRTNWGLPPPLQQQPGYGYMQHGAYPGALPQYTQPPYGGYPPQPAASTGYSSGWDQSSTQQTTPATGYEIPNVSNESVHI